MIDEQETTFLARVYRTISTTGLVLFHKHFIHGLQTTVCSQHKYFGFGVDFVIPSFLANPIIESELDACSCSEDCRI